MPPIRYEDRAAHLLSIYQHALAAADPAGCIDRNLALDGHTLRLQGQNVPLPKEARLILLAVGKAAVQMTRAAYHQLGSRLTRGLVVPPVGTNQELPPIFQIVQGGHPLPTQGSLAAGAAAQELIKDLNSKDVVLALISGGGSALLEILKPGISLHDLRQVNQLLLHSGAPIQEVNIVRKALSLSKAGGLARLAAPARVVGLILSDVMGDRLEAIASGPTVLEDADPAKAVQILKSYSLWKSLPSSVHQAFDQAPSVSVPTHEPINVIIGSNRILVDAAVERAVELGFEPASVKYDLAGEARQAGAAIAQELLDLKPGCCLIQGGETTVTVHGQGLGGRNQELALAAATRLAHTPDLALLSAASDGIDGPTDAAGAWVDGSTIQQAKTAGLNPVEFLNQNDSYTLFSRLDCLIKPGPTGTNVNDLVVGLKYTRDG